MRIAVSSDDGKTISGHLGRCAVFVVLEIEDGQIESRELRHNQTSHAAGGCSHDHKPGESDHSHGHILENLGDCQVVITRGMGRRLVDDLENSSIAAVITAEDDIQTAVDAYLDGKLVHLPERACGCHSSHPSPS